MKNSFKMYYSEKNKKAAEEIKSFLEMKGLTGKTKELSIKNKSQELLADLKADENETTWFITLEDNAFEKRKEDSETFKVTDGDLGLCYRTTAEAFALMASQRLNSFMFH